MYDVQIDRLNEDMVSLVLKQMKRYVAQENYEVQQRYDNILMLCRQCFKYEDHSMMENLKCMVYELNDDLKEGCAIREHRKYEYIVRENARISDEMLIAALSRSYDTRNIDINLDAGLIVLFRQIWLSGKTSPAVLTAMGEFMEKSDEFVVALTCYAIMLRCVRYYDRGLVKLLMERQTPEAYTSLAVILIHHAQRIAYDRSQQAMFAEFVGIPDQCDKLVQSMASLFKTHETKIIAEEFEKNIYPEVLKKRSDLHIDSIIDQGKNPDWEGLLGGSPLMDKMRKINDMQMKGKDVNYATFKAMKGYPFFSETAHWFYPFTLNYRELNNVRGLDEKSVEMLSRIANMCDSDRYSLLMMFKSMGISNMEAALGNMGIEKINDLKEMVDDDLKRDEEVRFSLRQRFSAMNIYRFYKLAPNHSDFNSPWWKEYGMPDVYYLKDVLPVEKIAELADTAFHSRDYSNALYVYETCADEMIDSDIHLYQKMGYCYEQNGDYEGAIKYYDRSDVILPDDAWTLRRLVHCHGKMAGHDAICIKLYRKLMEIEPDDTSNIQPLAELLYNQELYNEANTLLFRLEYAKPNFAVWELLARTLSKAGKYADAAKFFDKACNAKDSEPYTLVCAALNAMLNGEGDVEKLLTEAYGIVNDLDGFMQLFDKEFIWKTMEQITQEQRDKLTITINKIIIES